MMAKIPQNLRYGDRSLTFNNKIEIPDFKMQQYLLNYNFMIEQKTINVVGEKLYGKIKSK